MTCICSMSVLNTILNKYPIANIARLDALRKEEENQPKIFEEPKIVITETPIIIG